MTHKETIDRKLLELGFRRTDGSGWYVIVSCDRACEDCKNASNRVWATDEQEEISK